MGTHPKRILVGIFVARRAKNYQHLNRLRHADEKRGYRPDADDSQLDTACRLGGVYTDFVRDSATPGSRGVARRRFRRRLMNLPIDRRDSSPARPAGASGASHFDTGRRPERNCVESRVIKLDDETTVRVAKINERYSAD